jgi:hypothetical protein
VGRSLKEALLDQFALLQERGLAPSEVPQEEEAPLVVVESTPRGRSTRSRREPGDRYTEREDELALDGLGQFERDRRRGLRREHRAEDARERRRPSGRGRARPTRGEPETELGLPTPSAEPAAAPVRRAPMGPRRDRPPVGAPRPGGPPRVAGRTEMMQQRADQRRREQDEIAEMRRLLGELSSQEMDDAAMEAFSRALAEETGALPPPGIVVAAIKQAQSAEPRKIGDAVRAHYRRPRPRPQPPAPAPPPQVPASV